MLEKSLLIIN